MFNYILPIYITTMPLTLAGIANSIILTYTPNLKTIRRPIDNYLVLSDGKRLFGDNKTWLGLTGYIILSIIFSLIWGFFCQIIPNLGAKNLFYSSHSNSIYFNILIGLSLGAAYALFELPNSFLKRRFDIVPGKQSNQRSWQKYFFATLDHFDSAFGTILIIGLVHPLTWDFTILYLFLSGLTHWLIVKFLYLTKMRREHS